MLGIELEQRHAAAATASRGRVLSAPFDFGAAIGRV
jgi:hypothetical protein